MHSGTTYRVVTVQRKFLSQPGKVGAAPWQIEIDATNVQDAEAEHYQYTVLMDSDLKMTVELADRKTFAGRPLTLQAKLTAEGKPLTGLDGVYADVTRPLESLGGWYARNNVSGKEMDEIPTTVGDEVLPDVLRKARFLVDVRKVTTPARSKPARIRLFDDGTHGDRVAGDGVYTNRFENTQKEGTYAFHVRATGKAENCTFQREARIDRYVDVRVVSASLADIQVEKLPSYLEGIDRLRVTATPKDALGNVLGPRRARRLSIRPTWGRVVGNIQDNLDGSYSQVVETPSNLAQPQEFLVRFGQLSVTTKLPKHENRKPAASAHVPQQLERMQQEMRALQGIIKNK